MAANDAWLACAAFCDNGPSGLQNLTSLFCSAGALQDGLQQQGFLTEHGCRCTMQARSDGQHGALPRRPQSPGLNDLCPPASGPPPQSPGLSPPASFPLSQRPQSPCLSMHSWEAELLVTTVQLKTGYMQVRLGKAVTADQEMMRLLKQVRHVSCCWQSASRSCAGEIRSGQAGQSCHS